MIYTLKNFELHELIYPELYYKYEKAGKADQLYHCMDDRVLKTCDRLRDFLGCPVTVNNYLWGGGFSLSGLRPFDCQTGAYLSAHKFGRGADLKFPEPEKLRQYMKSIGCFEPGFKSRTDKEAFPFLLINRIEWAVNKEMSWFHFDVSSAAPGDGSVGVIRVNL